MFNVLTLLCTICNTIEQLQEKRTFVEGLKAGFPNLIVAQPRMCKVSSETRCQSTLETDCFKNVLSNFNIHKVLQLEEHTIVCSRVKFQ